MNARQKHSDFLLKYGDGAHIDKLLRVDHPTWPSERTVRDLMPYMYGVVSTAVKNPAISDKAAAKIAAFPHQHTPNVMAEYMRTKDHRDVHPDVLCAMAKHCGHREFMRSILSAQEKNMPKEGWQHLAQHVQQKIDGSQHMGSIEHNITEREHYMKMANK